MMERATLLFHSPCFDGIISALIASDFLRHRQGWPEPELRHVNYDLKATWLAERFSEPTAIVDFLYHPGAAFWADHHRTTFLNDEMRLDFEQRRGPLILYDSTADSCAGFLWRQLDSSFSYRNESYAELVTWAEKIDAAHYQSVEEAFSLDSPALKISISLALATEGYSEMLVKRLSELSVDETSRLPEVSEKIERARQLRQSGLERFRAAASLRDDIVVFDVDGRDVMVPRYAPYAVFPKARYSVGLTRYEERASITAMRNPWLEFESVALGDIFARHGGGGHQRVGSVVIRDPAAEDPRLLLEKIVSTIRKEDRQPSDLAAL